MFKIKKIEIETEYEYFAILTESDMKELRLNSKDRIKIINKRNNKKVICVLEIITNCQNLNKKNKKNKENKNIKLKKGEIGLFQRPFEKLDIKEGEEIEIVPVEKPSSLEIIKQKIEGKKLTRGEFRKILQDIVDRKYSKIETTFFVLACSFKGLNDQETINLTEAMVDVGKRLEFTKNKEEIIIDKHCIGGIPNNRTTMIIVPILASLGIKIPKSSSRSITSPAGTADTMEILCNVETTITKLYKQIKEINGAIVWGGSLELSPADDLIIQIEHPLEIDTEGQMIASILSKKKSVGSTHVLIDIPIGKTAKIKNIREAERLSKRFIKIGKAIGLKITTIITDGKEPIGNGIGPLFEAKDVLSVLKNRPDAPKDLKEKALKMSGIMLEMVKYSKKGQGYEDAKAVLESGMALNKFNEIIDYQGRKKIPAEGKYHKKIIAEKDGKIIEIDNKKIAKLAFILGAPQDKSAGIYLYKKTNSKIHKNEPLYQIYTNSEIKLKYALNYIKEHEIYKII